MNKPCFTAAALMLAPSRKRARPRALPSLRTISKRRSRAPRISRSRLHRCQAGLPLRVAVVAGTCSRLRDTLPAHWLGVRTIEGQAWGRAEQEARDGLLDPWAFMQKFYGPLPVPPGVQPVRCTNRSATSQLGAVGLPGI